MISMTISTRIDRPADAVFDYVSDVTKAPAWNTDVLEAVKTSDGRVGAGSTFHLRMKPAMGISEADLEIADFKPKTELVRAIRFGRMSSTHASQITVDGEATIYTEQIEVSMGGGLMVLLEPFFKGMVRKRNTAVVENLKRNLEEGHG
jgi:uncharacterized protein YndB with AHSA1/START domain